MYLFFKQKKQLGTINPVMNNHAAMRLCLGTLLLVFGIWASSSTGVHAQSIPQDIEPERVRPQTKIELPRIQSTPDDVDYFFEPSPLEIKPGEPYPLVHVRIPKAPYFEASSPSGPTRKYEIYIKMFYPNFSGLADRENAECSGNVRGHCRRQMIVGFGFRLNPNDGAADYERVLKDLNKGRLSPPTERSRYNGLELFAVQKFHGNPKLNENYYLARNANGRPAFVIRCNERVFSPSCSTRFRATKSPYVFISLDFVLSLLPKWQEMLPAVRNKVDSMIVQTYHIQSSEK